MPRGKRNAHYSTVPEQVVILSPHDIVERNPARKGKVHKVTFPLGEYEHLRVRLALIRDEKWSEFPAVPIGGSEDVYKIMKEFVVEPQEVMSVLYLDTKNVVVGVLELNRGGISDAAIEPRLLFAGALLCNATSLILVHNHPGGTLAPSKEDRTLTQTIHNAALIMGFRLLDHVIVARKAYVSLADESLMPTSVRF